MRPQPNILKNPLDFYNQQSAIKNAGQPGWGVSPTEAWQNSLNKTPVPFPTTSEGTNKSVTFEIPKISQPQPTGGLTADTLRSKFGFNDQNVINNILSDPSQRAKYEQELGGSGSSGEWDSLYSDSIRSLDNSIGTYQSHATQLKDELNQEALNTSSAYEQALGLTKKTFDNQKQELSDSQRALEMAARREYQQIQQNAMNRFGGGSSTSAAVFELAAREFMRSSGDIRQKYVSGQKQIWAAEAQADLNYQTSIKDLQNSLKAGISEINRQLDVQIMNINSQKAALEDNKKQMRYEAMRENIVQSKQLKANIDSKLLDLGVWAEQRKAELSNSQKAFDELASRTAAALKLSQTEMQQQTAQLPLNNVSQFFPSSKLSQTNPGDPYSELLTA